MLAAAGCDAASAGGTTASVSADANVARAGAYSFSDELGGFRIVSAAGTGTRDDPITVVQELTSATPVTMVIRAEASVQPFGATGSIANGFIHMRIVINNSSGLPWVEFEFELQERLGVPSGFGDGLSFDQRKGESDNIGSDSFARYSRDFEPYDRLRYENGTVDPLATAGFRFFITDFTPRWTFYLVEDPRIPSS
ncbi:MAG: hypothetical protein AB7S80_05950 [Rhizobiaceae bacterium]